MSMSRQIEAMEENLLSRKNQLIVPKVVKEEEREKITRLEILKREFQIF